MESGPLSSLLDGSEVRTAAEPFVRVLVRVPEAYPLLLPFEATCPGLLVLDADGRRVDALAVTEASDPAAIAAWITASLTAPARERFVLRVRPGEGAGTVASFAEAAGKLEGVERAEKAEERVTLFAKPGAFTPALLARLSAGNRWVVDLLEPAPVRLTAKEKGDPLVAARTLAGVPGVWAVAEEEGRLRAWATRILLDPAALAKALPEYAADIEARRFSIPRVSLGPPGMKVAQAVQDLPGVLSVVPALASESITVVGRHEGVAWPGVLEALRRVVPAAAEAR